MSSNPKINIKITSPYGISPGLRQTPQAKGIWGDCQFFLNESIDECDFWIVIDDVSLNSIDATKMKSEMRSF